MPRLFAFLPLQFKGEMCYIEEGGCLCAGSLSSESGGRAAMAKWRGFL